MVTPYLIFNGNAKEAINFYEEVFKSTDKKILLYKDAPKNPNFEMDPKNDELVMHATLTINNTPFKFSDSLEKVNENGMITLCVEVEKEEECLEMFNALKEDGKVIVDCAPSFFSPMYGYVVDKYSISWQIYVAK